MKKWGNGLQNNSVVVHIRVLSRRVKVSFIIFFLPFSLFLSFSLPFFLSFSSFLPFSTLLFLSVKSNLTLT